MIFNKIKLNDAFIIEIEKSEDDRGFFARSWDNKKFEEHELNSNLIQCNISFNKKKGTLRGMHYQLPPFAESKLIRCTRGSLHDVIIDLRKESKTYKKSFSIELSAENHKMIYVPEGFAHGFQTLEDNTEIFYQVSKEYSPAHAGGIRWDDSEFDITWPLETKIISKRDCKWKSFISGLDLNN
jgi:dTDP-4-dehydrorhamnose 3,5-epimerase